MEIYTTKSADFYPNFLKKVMLSNHTSKVATFHPELSKVPPQGKKQTKQKKTEGVTIKWSMKRWKTWVGERVCERYSLGFQCKRLCLSYLSLQCSLCFCEPLGGLVYKTFSGVRAVQYLIHPQNM